jgi:hypothetical protein
MIERSNSPHKGKDFQVSGPKVWLTGDVKHADFTPAVAWLKARTDVQELPSKVAPMSLVEWQFPAAIVFCQSRPGQISQDVVEAFHAQAPLARLVALAGCWCEGEIRSGQPWRGVTRIYWHQAVTRLPQELGLGAPTFRAPHRPRTETSTEAMLRALPAGSRLAPQAGLVAITTHSRDTYAALADICWARGLRSVWQMPGWPSQSHGADAVLIDGWPSTPLEHPERTIVLASFLRPADRQRAAELAVSAVLARPLFVPELIQAIEVIVGRSTGRATIAAA